MQDVLEDRVLVAQCCDACFKQLIGDVSNFNMAISDILYVDLLYFFRQMPTCERAEMTRTDLAQIVLQMRKLNITELHKFDFMHKPTNEYFFKAVKDLVAIGAMDARLLTITPHGKKVGRHEDPTYNL